MNLLTLCKDIIDTPIIAKVYDEWGNRVYPSLACKSCDEVEPVIDNVITQRQYVDNYKETTLQILQENSCEVKTKWADQSED